MEPCKDDGEGEQGTHHRSFPRERGSITLATSIAPSHVTHVFQAFDTSVPRWSVLRFVLHFVVLWGDQKGRMVSEYESTRNARFASYSTRLQHTLQLWQDFPVVPRIHGVTPFPTDSSARWWRQMWQNPRLPHFERKWIHFYVFLNKIFSNKKITHTQPF